MRYVYMWLDDGSWTMFVLPWDAPSITVYADGAWKTYAFQEAC